MRILIAHDYPVGFVLISKPDDVIKPTAEFDPYGNLSISVVMQSPRLWKAAVVMDVQDQAAGERDRRKAVTSST